MSAAEQQAKEWLFDKLVESFGTANLGSGRDTLVKEIVSKLGEMLRPVVEQDLRSSWIPRQEAEAIVSKEIKEIKASFETMKQRHGYDMIAQYCRMLRQSLEDAEPILNDENTTDGEREIVNSFMFLLALSEAQYARMAKEA